MYSPFSIGSVGNIATGSINPQNSNLNNISPFFAGLGFSSNPPYSPNSFTQFILDISWFFANPEGRAIAEIATIIPIFTFLIIYRSSKKEKDVIKSNLINGKKIDDIHKKIVEAEE